MTPSKGMIAGLYDAWVAARNSSGFPVGQQFSAPNAVSNGTTTHAYRIPHTVSVTAPAPTRVIATDQGGTKIRGKADLGISDFGEFQMTLSEYDEQFHAYVSGSSVDITTASGATITAANSQNPIAPQVILGCSVGFQDAVDGTFQYLTIIYPNVQIAPAYPGGTQDGGVNPNPLTYNITPNISGNTGFGFTFANTALNVQDDQDIVAFVRATKKYTVTTYIDDGAATAFALGYLPTSSAVDGSTNMITIDGAQGSASASAISTTTALVTWSAGSGGEVVIVAYPTDYVALP